MWGHAYSLEKIKKQTKKRFDFCACVYTCDVDIVVVVVVSPFNDLLFMFANDYGYPQL